MTDYRAELQRLVKAYDDHGGRWPQHHEDALHEAVEHARTTLAQPEPEPNPEPEIGPDWKPCRKLPITVHVREQRPGEAFVSTREGITPVMNDDLIMRGVKGEEYPIGRELFNQTYELVEPSQDDEVYFVVPPGGPSYWTSTRPIPCQR
jgi:hypothetical protein